MKLLLVDNVYKRIESGITFDENLNPYPMDILNKVLYLYESREDYEKCVFLRDVILNRYKHDELFNIK